MSIARSAAVRDAVWNRRVAGGQVAVFTRRAERLASPELERQSGHHRKRLGHSRRGPLRADDVQLGAVELGGRVVACIPVTTVTPRRARARAATSPQARP